MEAPRSPVARFGPSATEPYESIQQSTTDWARPASLVSLYLLFISFAVWARAMTVSSKSMRCRDAISSVQAGRDLRKEDLPRLECALLG